MQNFNKILSFILGLVVVVVFVAVLSGRLNLGLRDRLAGDTNTQKETLTPTPKKEDAKKAGQTSTAKPDTTSSSTKGEIRKASPVKEIPATGAPIAAVVVAFPALAAGMYLARFGKRK